MSLTFLLLNDVTHTMRFLNK